MPDSPPSLTDPRQEAQFKVLRAIHANPTLSQRELSKALGLSLGSTNFCIQALMERGWIKARHFKNSKNKIAYAYRLTPKGLDQKFSLTLAFLKLKQQEYEMLKREIRELKQDCSN